MLLGDGQRLFDASLDLADDEGIELTATRVIESPEVTHIRYAIKGRATLGLDDRGRAAVRRSDPPVRRTAAASEHDNRGTDMEQGATMKYMLLIYGNEENFTSISIRRSSTRSSARPTRSTGELLESGELVGAYGVADCRQRHGRAGRATASRP